MVATLVKLKLRLTLAELKRSTARLVIWIIVALYVGGFAVAAVVGLAASSMALAGHEATVQTLTVWAGAAVVVGWTVLPLLFFGSDQTLDPARFAQFPLKGRQLATGLLVAGVVGLPGLLTAVVALGSALPWLLRPGALLAGLVGGAAGWAMAQLGCRTAAAALSATLSSRRAKDFTGVVGLILVLALSSAGYGFSLLTGSLASDPARWQRWLDASGRTATWLAWTPLGAPWALAGDAGRGHLGLLAGHVVATVAYLGFGWWVFGAVLEKALVTPPPTTVTGAVAKGDTVARTAGWRWARGSLLAVAVIARRCLVYWRRDPRYIGQVASIVLMPVLFTIFALTIGYLPSDNGQAMPAIVPTGLAVMGIGLLGLMAGYTLSADVAYDSTAWWIHLTTGVRGWQDRLGRVVGEAVWALPVVVAGTSAVLLAVGGRARLAPALGAALCLYLVSLGVSSVASALIVYPVPLPGESPLKMRTASMGQQALSQFGCLLASGLLALPVCLWALFATGWQGGLVLAAGVVWGGALTAGGVAWGGRVMDSRGPAILATLQKNDSRARG